MSGSSSAFELKGLSLKYPEGPLALDDVTLDLRRGGFVVLLGPSGAGKSTLLRCLNHLAVPTAGSVHLADGSRLGGNADLKMHRRRTGMIFQSHQLIKRHPALNNVLMGRLGYHSALRTLLPFGRPEVRLALNCLERVGLADKAMSRCDRLSGGERQRVGIARALCQQPEVILADEPVASLDPAASARVLQTLRDVCAQDNLTAVVSLHQVDYALKFADRIIGLSRGRVVYDGPPAQLDKNALEDIYGKDLDGPEPVNNNSKETTP